MTTTLADQFLADLESDDEDIDIPEESNTTLVQEINLPDSAQLRDQITSLSSVSKLLFDDRIEKLRKNIENFSQSTETIEVAPIQQSAMFERMDLTQDENEIDPAKHSYSLIVECNDIIREIGDEITAIHKFVRDLYSHKFPELESLVLNPLDYVRVVKRISNAVKISSVELNDLLPAPTVMVVKMSATASSNSSNQLPEDQLNKVIEACEGVLKLEEDRTVLLSFVESRMSFIAPNLSCIVGTDIAARLIGIAGGMIPLSRLPASTIQILGSDKKTLEGFSTAATKKHVGHIWECDLIQQTPPSLRKKAVRVVAGKCALAARVDGYGDSKDGATGQELREEILKKIEKWQERPPAKQIKALPAPDDKPKPKRGGKRMRKMKARYAMTEYRKYSNRMVFGEAEETLGNTEHGFGMLGAANRVKLHIVRDKKLQKQLQHHQQKGKKNLRTTTAGTATGLSSTLLFAPGQGIELVDPEMVAKRETTNNHRYFTKAGTYTQVKTAPKLPPPAPMDESA